LDAFIGFSPFAPVPFRRPADIVDPNSRKAERGRTLFPEQRFHFVGGVGRTVSIAGSAFTAAKLRDRLESVKGIA
jgi:hypothetical protein